MPVYSLLGKVRDEIHAYYNTRGATIDEAVEDARRAVDLGFVAVKDHFYHPVDENIRWLTAIREAVGDEIDCMHDPVAIYTFEEAFKVGHALEELDYRWFEEPLPERSHNLLVKLASTLDIPIMATETFMYDTDLCAQYLDFGCDRPNSAERSPRDYQPDEAGAFDGDAWDQCGVEWSWRSIWVGPCASVVLYPEHILLRVLSRRSP